MTKKSIILIKYNYNNEIGYEDSNTVKMINTKKNIVCIFSYNNILSSMCCSNYIEIIKRFLNCKKKKTAICCKANKYVGVYF